MEKCLGTEDFFNSKFQTFLSLSQGRGGGRSRRFSFPVVHKYLVASPHLYQHLCYWYIMGMPQSPEQCSSASLTRNLGKYDSPHGLGLHAPVVLVVVISPELSPVSPPGQQRSTMGQTERSGRHRPSTELKALCSSRSPSCGHLPLAGSQKLVTVVWRTAKFMVQGDEFLLPNMQGSPDKMRKSANCLSSS